MRSCAGSGAGRGAEDDGGSGGRRHSLRYPAPSRFAPHPGALAQLVRAGVGNRGADRQVPDLLPHQLLGAQRAQPAVAHCVEIPLRRRRLPQPHGQGVGEIRVLPLHAGAGGEPWLAPLHGAGGQHHARIRGEPGLNDCSAN
jgi:hypothetical protein